MFTLDKATLETIQKTFHVPTKPELLQELEALNSQASPDIVKAANLIQTDVGLAGIILQTINSPIFGLNRQVADIKQAVIALGFKTVYSITVTSLIQQSFSKPASISLERFWDESLLIAQFCKHIAASLNSSLETDTMYCLGLIHNLGIAAMAIEYSDYKETLALANDPSSHQFTAVERIKHGNDHAEVGYVICEQWQLPSNICQIVAQHHNKDFLFDPAPFEQKEMYAILRLATNLYTHIKHQHYEGDWPNIRDELLEVLELGPKQVDTLEIELAEIAQKI